MSETEVIDGEAQLIEETRNLPAVRASEAVIAKGEISVDEIVAQRDKIVDVMSRAMKEDVHYGKIPGVNKPTLLKAGAEVLNQTLRLAPDYESDKMFHDDGHLTVTSKCTLRHIPTGLVIASGEGLCSSRETKYAYRQGGRSCPECGAAAIIKGKQEYGGGWLCFGRKGGCGAKWADGTDQALAFANADVSRVDNPDLPDTWNTVVKMANKRALVAAVLNGTAASDVFTQDAEDMTSQSAQSSAEPAANAQPASQSTESTQTRQAAQNGFQLPGTWAKIEEAIKAYGTSTYLDWLVFATQAKAFLYGDEKPPGTELRQLTARAAKRLRDVCDPSEFPPPTRQQMIDAWKPEVDGNELAGPEWRMSPDETDREPRKEPES